MKLKLVAAISALAIPAFAHAQQSGPQPTQKRTKADAQKVVQLIPNWDYAQDAPLSLVCHFCSTDRQKWQ